MSEASSERTPRFGRGRWRSLTGVADQAVSSLTNFVASGVALVLLTESGFGSFVVVQACLTFALTFSRSIFSEPYVEDAPDERLSRTSLAGANFVLGLAASPVIFALISFGGGGLGLAVLASATIPLILLQDMVRYRSFANDGGESAFRSDVSWLALELIFFAGVALVPLFELSALSVAGAWLLAGACVGARELSTSFGKGSVANITHYLGARRSRIALTLRENLAVRFGPALIVLLAGFYLAPNEVGLAFAPRTTLGIVTILYVSATSYGLAVASRLRRDGATRDKHRRFISLLSAGLPACAAFVTAAVILTPDNFLQSLPGGSDPGAFRLRVLVVGSGMAFAGFNHSRRVGLRSAGQVALSSSVQARVSVLQVILATIGGLASGPTGVILGIAGSHAVASPVWWRAGRAALAADVPERPLSK